MSQAWRLCRAPFATLDGEGARLAGGRWNSPGRAVVYLSDHPALAVLEVRVHMNVPLRDLPPDYVLLHVSLPDGPGAPLPEPIARTVAAGDAWLEAGEWAVLRVPSAIVPRASNLLLNPLHPAAAGARVAETIPFRFDERLWHGS